MVLIDPNPVGTFAIITPCCHADATKSTWTDGIMEAMGKEPINWHCAKCRKAYRFSDIFKRICKHCGYVFDNQSFSLEEFQFLEENCPKC